jgi:hypothetical protein
MTTHSDDFDRDGDQQSAYSEDKKERILRDARATAAHSDDQDILPRDLDQPFSDDERRSILHRAHALLVGHETPEIVDDDRTWSEDEKQQILQTARANIRCDAATGMITKVKMQDAFEAEAPEARQPRQRYQRRRRSEAGADEAYRDRIEGTAWPAPREGNLDITLEGLIGARVETAFAGQHDYILEIMAQALAGSVDKDGVVERAIADAVEKERRQHRRDVRELKARIGTLERSLDELRDAVALEKSRALTLPALPARRDLN